QVRDGGVLRVLSGGLDADGFFPDGGGHDGVKKRRGSFDYAKPPRRVLSPRARERHAPCKP
ncbi:hypothetical protein ACQV5M_21340, partial [Leptospira sp. SA-E8]|uniref:hypothetical protein n=1 Tax=Leptospira sp. SA-E8 TaxID=3422259 RepID=UPI003EBBC169